MYAFNSSIMFFGTSLFVVGLKELTASWSRIEDAFGLLFGTYTVNLN